MRPTLPEQVPAPSELDAAIAALLGGDAQGSLDQLQRLRASLGDGDEALAASAAVASWEVIAHCAMLLPENGDELLEQVTRAEQRLAAADIAEAREVAALHHLAQGVHLKALADFEAALTHLRTASDADGPWTALAMVWTAEATLNTAYDENNEKLERPEKIDEARPIYAKASKAARRDLVRGMALEGLAMIAEMKREPKVACEHAAAALEAYEQAGASAYRLEGPQVTLDENNCDPTWLILPGPGFGTPHPEPRTPHPARRPRRRCAFRAGALTTYFGVGVP